MARITHPLYLLVPEELMGMLLLFMIVGAGFAIMLGFRKVGTGLLITAISIPFLSAILEAIMNDIFSAMPDALVLPVAYMLMATIYLAMGWMFIKMAVGERAIDNAKGQVLASAIIGLFKLAFSRRMIAFVFAGLILSVVMMT